MNDTFYEILTYLKWKFRCLVSRSHFMVYFQNMFTFWTH